MFKNVKVSTLIGMGFGSILLLLLVLSTFSYKSMGTAANGFSEYRGLARDTNLAGRLQANMLMVRMNVKDFIITGSQKDVDQYNDYVEKMQGFLEEAKKEIQKPERARNVKFVSDNVGSYKDNFSKVLEMKKQRDTIVLEHMNKDGLAMRQNLTEIMKTAYADGDPDAAYYAGRIQEHVLLARLYAVKFLDTNAQEDVDRFQKEIGPEIDHLAVTLSEGLQNETRRKLFKEFMELREKYTEDFNSVVSLIFERNDVITNQLDRMGPEIATAIEDVKLSVKQDQDALGPVLQANNEKTVRMIIIVSIIALAVGIFLAWFTARLITTPLGGEPSAMAEIAEKISLGDLSMQFDNSQQATGLYAAMQNMTTALKERAQLADTIAAGDMTANVKLNSENDVLGKALKTMTEKLNKVISEINSATEQVASGALQVSDSNQSLSQGATEQAASLEQITSSMTEMGSQTKTNAENAAQANQLSGDARQAAEAGNEQMQNMVTAMTDINEAGQNISKIIKVIDEIAFQTNLLALNAAVEAARAGRHGKGFAVVAEEVRNLAARSAKAAKETAELIEGSVEKTNNGTDIANQTAESLAEIVSSVGKVTDLVSEIAAASNEQAEGISQVNQGLSQVDQVTQQNTASAEEGAAAAEELSGQAEHMRQLMSQFKVQSQGSMGLQQDTLSQPVQQRKVERPEAKVSRPSPKPSEMIALDDSEFGKY